MRKLRPLPFPTWPFLNCKYSGLEGPYKKMKVCHNVFIYGYFTRICCELANSVFPPRASVPSRAYKHLWPNTACNHWLYALALASICHIQYEIRDFSPDEIDLYQGPLSCWISLFREGGKWIIRSCLFCQTPDLIMTIYFLVRL